MSSTTQDTRRRTPSDLRNRPTKRLLKDVNHLKQRQVCGDLTTEEAALLRATERELRGRTGGLAKKVRHA